MPITTDMIPWPVKGLTEISGEHNYRYECPDCSREFYAHIEFPNPPAMDKREVDGVVRIVRGKPGQIPGFCPDCQRAMYIPNPKGGLVSKSVSLSWKVQRKRGSSGNQR